MSTTTFMLPPPHPQIPIHVPLSSTHTSFITRQELLAFPAFKTWLTTLLHSLSLQTTNPAHPFHNDPYTLRSITMQSIDRFGGNRLGFLKLSALIQNGTGEKLPGIALLRGGSVAMLVLLQPDDVPTGSEEDKHVLLTVQPQVAAGALAMVEIPAGMVDDAGGFAGAAAKEIEEECGLRIEVGELVDLTALAMEGADNEEGLQMGVYTSPGGSDEFIPIFLYQKRVKRESLSEWTGKLTGLRDHGEKITLKCVKLEGLWREGARDAKTLAAWALYEGLRREGKLPG